MAGISYTSKTVNVSHNALNGGLNSTSGNLNLKDNESSDLQNIDFDKFGSILKRNGYTCLNTGGMYIGSSTESVDALVWAEFTTGGSITRAAVCISGAKIYKMDDLDGVWDDVTGGATITSGNQFDVEMYNTTLFATNGVNAPVKWVTGDTANVASVPTGLTKAKYVKQFNNYLFYANVTVGGLNYPTRLYWSALRDPTSFDSADWLEVSKDDGQEITGLRVLSDRLVVFKDKAIYNVFFTGDSDIPFTLPGGGKANSAVGCISSNSIQEVENGLVFLSSDGLYYYDGMNAYKISDKITETLMGYNTTQLSKASSLVYKKKSQYWLALPSSGQTKKDRVVVWDYFNNAFSIYVGMNVSSLATFFISGVNERPYFGDYDGFVYRADIGRTDYPVNVATAINSYYWTNWKHYDDLGSQKGIPQIYIYYQENSAVLTFSYSYDFEENAQYSHTINMSGGTAVYGTAVYGTDIYAGAGGAVVRRDLTGRGRVVRFRFSNSVAGETYRIDGFGSSPHLETNV
jgi:hypothetical protein